MTISEIQKSMVNVSVDVSCVVVGHHESHVISATIHSVLRAVEFAQKSGIKTELIVILDDPDDETASVVNNFSNENLVVHTVFYKDLAKSRNHAVEIANGKYVTFIDGDDLWCKTWICSCLRVARQKPACVLHPEYNIYFGSNDSHVLHHLDMEDVDFIKEAIYRENYWTALAFADRSIYEKYKYHNNEISEGFGYEDWTWNVATIDSGISHHVVKGTCHFIRRTSGDASLLNITNSSRALPRILPMYRVDGRSKDSADRSIEKTESSRILKEGTL